MHLNCIHVQANIIFIHTEVLAMESFNMFMWIQTLGAVSQCWSTCDIQLKGCTWALGGSVLSAMGRFNLDFLDFRGKFTVVLTWLPQCWELHAHKVKRKTWKQRTLFKFRKLWIISYTIMETAQEITKENKIIPLSRPDWPRSGFHRSNGNKAKLGY